MFKISHRGNLDGRNPQRENSPPYIKEALLEGYDVEIDIYSENGVWFLGHQAPQYPVDFPFLETPGLWIHCKNIRAFEELQSCGGHLNYFWHEYDKLTLTSKGYPWSHVDYPAPKGSIALFSCPPPYEVKEAIGVCSDYINTFSL